MARSPIGAGDLQVRCSLPRRERPVAQGGTETADSTLYAGVRPWHGAELWVNPEIDQGRGLNNTLGVAGFASGESYKVGGHPGLERIVETYYSFGLFAFAHLILDYQWVSHPAYNRDRGPVSAYATCCHAQF